MDFVRWLYIAASALKVTLNNHLTLENHLTLRIPSFYIFKNEDNDAYL